MGCWLKTFIRLLKVGSNLTWLLGEAWPFIYVAFQLFWQGSAEKLRESEERLDKHHFHRFNLTVCMLLSLENFREYFLFCI
jgi:hypothetical protein